MGFLIRELSLFNLQLQTRSQHCKNCSKQSKNASEKITLINNTTPGRQMIKRRLDTRKIASNDGGFMSKTEMVNPYSQNQNYIVTKPQKVYKLSELIPPSFFGSEESHDFLRDSRPTTYQSYLAAKYNLKQSKYPTTILTEPLASDAVENNFRGEKYLSENYFQVQSSDEVTEKSNSDWKVHWIEK